MLQYLNKVLQSKIDREAEIYVDEEPLLRSVVMQYNKYLYEIRFVLYSFRFLIWTH